MTRRSPHGCKPTHFLSGFHLQFNKLRSFSVTALALIGMLFLAACGGGGGGGGGGTSSDDINGTQISALILPNRVELTKVDTSGGTTAAFLKGLRAADETIYNASGTDYNLQGRESWTEDMSGALEMVNEILDVVKDTGYDQMVNEGDYVALVVAPGDDGGNAGGSGGATTNTTTENLQEMTVNVTRADEDSPMYVSFWLDIDSGPDDMPMRVKGRFEVTQGVSDEYPVGEMTAYFIGVAMNNGDEVNPDEPIMRIAMDIGSDNDGNATVQFVERETMDGNLLMSTKLNVIADDADFQSGQAYVYRSEPTDWDNPSAGMDKEEMLIRFNENYIKVDENGEILVFDKDPDTLSHEVFRYKLYTADNGAKVDINSGFPIRFADGMHGYVGYYGLWAPEDVTIGADTTVVREGTNDTYQIIQKAGKLIKHTRQEIQVGDLAGVELSKYSDVSDGDLVVTWDDVTEQFIQIGFRGPATNWQTVELTEAQGYGDPVTFEEWEGTWCETLRAWMPIGQLYANSATPSNTTPFSYHAEKTVIPGSSDFPSSALTLYYYGPDPGDHDWMNASLHTYIFDPESLMLYEGAVAAGNEVIYTPGGVDDWGNWHLQPLTLDQNANGWEEDVFYSWSTGEEEWHMLTVLKDTQTGAFVPFDAPLRLSFTVAAGDDWNNDDNAGKTFGTEYDGFSLHIPWIYDEDEDEWYPILNLKDSHETGLILTDVDGTEYVLKGVEEELMFTEIPEADWGLDPAIAALEIVEVNPPTIGDDMNANINTIFYGAGADWTKPVDAELKVIKGELIEAE